MKSKISPLTVVTIAAMFIGSISATYPQPQGDNGCKYFDVTRHYVCGEFLEYYETRGGLEIFGYPITEAFNDPTRGQMLVQYFQSARMELHEQNPDPYRVLLGLLTDELGYHFPPANEAQIPPRNNDLHHYFSETGHVVSYAFLDFFRAKGGIDIFGYPRSEFMYEDGRIVQYFQRARMEWYPEATSGSQMRLTSLGETYVDRFGVPVGTDDAQPPPIFGSDEEMPTVTPPPPITRLNVSASVRYVITGREGGQTVFVYVTDQQQQPVSGAMVKIMVHYPWGSQPYEFNEPTNDSGFTGHYFDILPASPGQKVVIAVTVTHGSLTGTTQTFFLPWW
jgi:hypothetical protein